jgi:hypothetical protein
MMKILKYTVFALLLFTQVGCAMIVSYKVVKVESPVKGASVYLNGSVSNPEFGISVRKHKPLVATSYKSGYRPKSQVFMPKRFDLGIVLDLGAVAIYTLQEDPTSALVAAGITIWDIKVAALRHKKSYKMDDMEKLPANTTPGIVVLAHTSLDSLKVIERNYYSYKSLKKWEKRNEDDFYITSTSVEYYNVENWMDSKLSLMKYQESRPDFIAPYDRTVQIDADILNMEVYEIKNSGSSVKLNVRFFICDNFGNRLLPFEAEGESQVFYSGDWGGNTSDAFKDAMYVAMMQLLNSDEFKNSCQNMSKLFSNSTVDMEAISLKKPLIGSPDFQEMVNSQVTISNDENYHGSGCMISPEGHLLASYRVVGDKDSVDITFSNGVSKMAKVLRKDPILNVVLLKADTLGNASIRPVSSKDYNVGEDVFAVGAPVDRTLSQSLTSGVISSEHFVNGVNYLQTDVKISKGDNGSPLINRKGQLIGIVNEKYIGDYLEGISFAVSAKDILERMKIKYEN